MNVRTLVILALVAIVAVAVYLAVRGGDDGADPNRPSKDPTPEVPTPADPWEYLEWALDQPVEPQLAAIEAVAALDDPRAEKHVARFTVADEDGDYEDEEVGMHAFYALAKSGGKVTLEQIKDALEYSDEDWDVEEWTARTVAHIPGEGSLKLLLRLSVDDDDTVRQAAGIALASWALEIGALDIGAGELARDAIKGLVNDEEEEVAATAAGLLVHLGDPDAAAAVKRALEEEDEDYDAALALGLGIPGNERARPWLDRLLAREETSSRVAAVKAIGATKVADAMPRLKALMEDEELDVRATAAAAIAANFGAESVDDGIRMAIRRGITESDEQAVRLYALKALISVAKSTDRQVFTEVLTNAKGEREDDDFRVLQAWAAQGLLRTAE